MDNRKAMTHSNLLALCSVCSNSSPFSVCGAGPAVLFCLVSCWLSFLVSVSFVIESYDYDLFFL